MATEKQRTIIRDTRNMPEFHAERVAKAIDNEKDWEHIDGELYTTLCDMKKLLRRCNRLLEAMLDET
jgi:hypothetical protein